MALRKDNFFSLTKGERRATLSLLVILLLLVGARVARQHYHSRAQEQPAEEYTGFQNELKEFNNTLQKTEQPQEEKGRKGKESKEKKTKEKKEAPPKDLKPVPREE